MRHSPSAYAAIADLVHHVRTELSADQLARVAKLYSALIHNPYLGHNLHTLFAKMMFGLIENITTKDTPQGAARVLGAMFETCVDKVDAMTAVLDNALDRMEKAKNGDETPSPILLIEKARPVAGAVQAIEKPEEVIHGKDIPANRHCHDTNQPQNVACYSEPSCTGSEFAWLG